MTLHQLQLTAARCVPTWPLGEEDEVARSFDVTYSQAVSLLVVAPTIASQEILDTTVALLDGWEDDVQDKLAIARALCPVVAA